MELASKHGSPHNETRLGANLIGINTHYNISITIMAKKNNALHNNQHGSLFSSHTLHEFDVIWFGR